MANQTSKASSWWIAVRPHTLPAAAASVLVGWGMAYDLGEFKLLPALAALLCALLFQIISNLVNDVMDYQKGTDNPNRQGFQRVVQSGLLSPKEIWTAVIFLAIIISLIGVYLVSLRGIWALVIGVFALVSAIAYTAGPFPLAYKGFGDLFVFIFFGPVSLLGTVFVISGKLHPSAWLASIAMGLLITAILVVNNLRDIETDRKAGKRTFAVIVGERGAKLEYTLLLVGAYALPVAVWMGGGPISKN